MYCLNRYEFKNTVIEQFFIARDGIAVIFFKKATVSPLKINHEGQVLKILL